ncbi:MAG: nicotinamide-nucleotide amidohydrolase family protein [Nocardioides sp.]
MRDASSADGQAAALLVLLARAGATLATAESLTGGRLAALVTSVPGASRVYVGGVVAYAPAVKQSVLGVPHDLVLRHGVVSAECARAMATGVRSLTGAEYAVSTTGVAGPDPSEGQRPGTVFVGVAGPAGDHALALMLAGDRAAIADLTCRAALTALSDMLADSGSGLPVEETRTR